MPRFNKTKVYPGDVVTAQVYVKYADFNSDEVNIMPLVNYVASSFVMPAGIDGGITPDLNFMNGSWYSGFLGNNTTTSEPRAFLNSILLDNNLQVQRDEDGNPLIDIVQVSEAAKIPEDGSGSDHELLKLAVTVKKEGYIYIYLSNDDQQDMDVYFDDFKVTHKLNDIVAGGDYYPFGSVMAGREITRDDYRFGYQGQFSEHDEETGWNSFEARMYDSKIGRFIGMDPARQFISPFVGMANNPVNGVDPDGRVFNPIYGSDGTFRGVDEFGLQGEAIIYDGNFQNGMSQNEILSNGGQFFSDFNFSGNIGAMFEIVQHWAGLPLRPDWDGVVTFSEAIDWYHDGNGQPLYVDISKMDFKSSTLSVEAHFKNSDFSQANFFWGDTHPLNPDIPWVGGDFTMAFVYGTLRVNLLDRHTGLISLRNEDRYGGGFDTFDFNIGLYESVANGMRSNGRPTPFNFMGYGKGYIHVKMPVLH